MFSQSFMSTVAREEIKNSYLLIMSSKEPLIYKNKKKLTLFNTVRVKISSIQTRNFKQKDAKKMIII